jgi:hypothetical protein
MNGGMEMDFRERIIRKLAELLKFTGDFQDYTDVNDSISMKLKKGVKDNHSLKGNFHFRLWDTVTGETVREFDVANTVTELGDAMVADAMSDRSVTLPTHMAIGTGDGSTGAAALTTLPGEAARVALTGGGGVQGTVGADNDVVWSATFPAGTGTASITDAGVFNAASNGVMAVVAGFGVITKDALMQLDVVWTLTCGAS